MPRKSKIEYVNTFNGKLGHCLNNQMKKKLTISGIKANYNGEQAYNIGIVYVYVIYCTIKII